MSKIANLNSEQKARLEEYRQRWFQIGMCNDRSEKPRVKRAVADLYQSFGKRPPTAYKWYESPGAYLAKGRKLFRRPPRVLPIHEVVDDHHWSVRARRFRQWDCLRSSIESSVIQFVEDKLSGSGQTCIRQIFELVPRSLRTMSGEETAISSHAERANAGQSNGPRISFFLFWRDVLGVQYPDNFLKLTDPWRAVAESCFLWWSDGNCCAVSERPIAVETESSGTTKRLHCDQGPALVFADGWAVYALHGVPVSKEIVMTPAHSIDPKILLTTRNAEVRREIIRKIGLDHVFGALGAESVDKEQGYELVLLDFGDGRRRPYLSMINPSTGASHVEGVHPDCRTVRQALLWRNGTGVPPAHLT